MAVRVSRFALPACRQAALELEAGKDVGFGVDDDGVEGEEVGGGEEEVEVFEGFGLWIICVSCSLYSKGASQGGSRLDKLTSQKLSMSSFTTGGISFAFDRLVKPAPSSTALYWTNDLNISHPHSLYMTSPVIRHM